MLKALKRWRDNELLPVQQCERLQADVVAVSLPPPAAPTVPDLEPAAPTSSKKPRLESGQRSIFSWKGAERQRVLKTELRAQREAAARGEDYDVEMHPVIRFPTENMEVEEAPPAPRKCPKCARTFNTPVGLHNHLKWHRETMKDKLFTPPPPKVLPRVECELCVDGGAVQVCLRIGGRTRAEMLASVEAGEREQVERIERQINESEKRRADREKAGEEDRSEQRKGSSRRGSFTARMKLKVWPPPQCPQHPQHHTTSHHTTSHHITPQHHTTSHHTTSHHITPQLVHRTICREWKVYQ